MNKFQKIVHNRIAGLLLDAESAGGPQHNPTAGWLREKYIIQFLKDMTPWGISLTSGVLFDVRNTVSPQIDLIAVNNVALPAIALHEGLSMVPVEAALIAAEIKSSLTTDGLEQLAKFNECALQLQVVGYSNFFLPTIMVALDSQLSKERVIEWMQTKVNGELVNRNTTMCCVVGKFHLVRQKDEIKVCDKDGHYQETMSFISDFWGALKYLQRMREVLKSPDRNGYPHPLEAYLKGMGQTN
jgi:hypothetical protein